MPDYHYLEQERPEGLHGNVSRGRFKAWLILVAKVLGVAFLLLTLAVLVWFRHALYNRFVEFPRQEKAWEELRGQAQPVASTGSYKEYRGILHSHSELSHDCEVPFETIAAALHQAGVDFICMSDHCTDGRADFSVQWRGIHGGKLFIPGFEMKDGLMPFGVRAGTVLSNSTPAELLARQVVQHGGLLFIAHPEGPRAWDLPELTGMEIYNIHTDFKRLKGGFSRLLPELLVNHRRYPEQVFRLIFQRPEEFLRRWDDLNRTRHITGIAGNDCHQNTGLRAFYTTQDTLRLEDTSPETLAEWRLNFLTRPLLRLWFGPLTPGRQLFHFQLDPYDRMARYVNTHVLANELSEPAVLEALRSGRAFVGFDLIADSSGFSFRARNQEGPVVIFGEKLVFSDEVIFEADSPLPCRFAILQDGRALHQSEGRHLRWSPPGPGKFRIEAELKIGKEWVPWVYGNPIECVRAGV